MIIGISGKKGSGKDLTAKLLQEKYPDKHFEIVRFADTLKDMVCVFLGCTREQLEDREFKEKSLGSEWNVYLPYSPRLDKFYNTHVFCSWSECNDYIERNLRHSGIEDTILPRLREMTPRLLLQNLGTEWGRNIIHPDVWILSTFSKMKKDKNYIVPDVRFPNEADFILRKQGILLRIERTKIEFDNHPSEIALDNYSMFTEIIENNGTVNELRDKIFDI